MPLVQGLDLHAHARCTLQWARTAQDHKKDAWRTGIDFRQCLRSTGEQTACCCFAGTSVMVAILLAITPKQQKWSWVLFEFRVCKCYKVLCWASSVYTDNTLYSLNTPHQFVHVMFCLSVGSASWKVAATEGFYCTTCWSLHSYMVSKVLGMQVLTFVCRHVNQWYASSARTELNMCCAVC